MIVLLLINTAMTAGVLAAMAIFTLKGKNTPERGEEDNGTKNSDKENEHFNNLMRYTGGKQE